MGILPWPAASRPAAAEWLKRNEGPLALFVAASKRPRFFSPLVTNDDPPVISSESHGRCDLSAPGGSALLLRNVATE